MNFEIRWPVQLTGCLIWFLLNHPCLTSPGSITLHNSFSVNDPHLDHSSQGKGFPFSLLLIVFSLNPFTWYHNILYINQNLGLYVKNLRNLRSFTIEKNTLTQLTVDRRGWIHQSPTPDRWPFSLCSHLPILKVGVRNWSPLPSPWLPIKVPVTNLVSTNVLLRWYFWFYLSQTSRRFIVLCTSKDFPPYGSLLYLRDGVRGVWSQTREE